MTDRSRFFNLPVIDIRPETAESISVALRVPADLAKLFSYVHGQYITVEIENAGDQLRRPYSIASGLDDNEIRIGVKRTNGGLVSTWLNDNLKIGDNLRVMPPQGRFTAPLQPESARNHLFVAAGSGITPILGILRSVLAREPLSRCVLIYGNRRQSDIMFLETIEDMKNIYLDRLTVFHVLSREQGDVMLLNGRINAARVASLIETVMPADKIDNAFLCGPGTMLDDVQAGLQKLGMRSDTIHREIFTPATGKRGPAIVVGTPRTNACVNTADTTNAELVLDGRRHFITIAKDETIIEAAQRQGIDAPFACKGGMCCTCRAQIVEGEVEMAQNYSLEPRELQKGFVLTCQSRPKSEKLIVDYDAR